MITVFDAWVINTQSMEGHGLIGRYWWFDKKTPRPGIPIHMEGCHVAMFTTRRIAREHLQSVRHSFPKAKVVHVKVRIIDKIITGE